MRLPLTGPLCAALAGVTASVVAAAPPTTPLEPEVLTGSHIRVEPDAVEGTRRDRLIDVFSHCIVSRSPSRADYYLRRSDAAVIDPSLGNLNRFLSLDKCLGRASGFDSVKSVARFSVQGLRSWLAEEAYRRANVAYVPLPSDAPEPPKRVYFAAYPDRLRAIVTAEFSDCLVARDGAGADAVLRTKRGSEQEEIAARALASVLGSCIPSGQKLTLPPETIRAYAADGLWQRYEAPKPATYKGRN